MDNPKRKLTKGELIERAIERMAKKLDHEAPKGTIGDLVRLLQLQKEMGFDQPTKVTVQWVDKNEK